jgi:hypothetical protein
MTTILLGPQRFMTTAGSTLRSLGLEGPVATITAGWEERELQDDELDAILDGRSRNLRLYTRMLDVLNKDESFGASAIDLRDRLDELHAFYGLRVQAAMEGVYAVQRRTSRHGTGELALESAVESVRAVDAWYTASVKALYREFDQTTPTSGSEVIGWHRGELDRAMADCVAVVLTGGHVGALLRALRMFRVRLPAELPVIAWSAGAMALTSQVVLFHDHAPQGISEAQLYDRGLGRLPRIVALPHARRRLRLEDRGRAGVLARRLSAYTCLLLDDGTSVRFEDDGSTVPPGARVLGEEGTVTEVRPPQDLEAAPASSGARGPGGT